MKEDAVWDRLSVHFRTSGTGWKDTRPEEEKKMRGTLKSDGTLNEKYPGGGATQAKRLMAEGHTIEPAKGNKRPRVTGWEDRLLLQW